jgi:hypothetical protein
MRIRSKKVLWLTTEEAIFLLEDVSIRSCRFSAPLVQVIQSILQLAI